MTLRRRGLLIGSVAGAAGPVLGLAAMSMLGAHGGLVAGTVLAGLMGALAALAVSAGLEERIHSHLAAIEGSDPDLPPSTVEPFQIDGLDEMIERVWKSMDRARHSRPDHEALERVSRSLWTRLHGPAVPMPDGPRCAAALLEFLGQTTEVIRRHAAALDETNERMAHGALDQTETVARTTSAVEAISEKIDRISQNAEHASEACERTRLEARRGLEQVHRVIEGMDRLRAQTDVNGRTVRRLGDRSVEIGTIVELIRGISGRTDMLALNATIESVRAGEHGRGFAVVADEIRKLAERTAAATRDVSALVEAIQADTHESVRALGEEQSEMDQESQRVREAGSALERISQMTENSASLVDGISRSTNDQVLAAQELVRAMQRIADVSHLVVQRSGQSRESILGLTQCCERLAPLAVGNGIDIGAEAATTPAPRPVTLRISKSGSSVRMSR